MYKVGDQTNSNKIGRNFFFHVWEPLKCIEIIYSQSEPNRFPKIFKASRFSALVQS